MATSDEKKPKRSLLSVLSLIVVGGILGMIVSLISAEAVHLTSGDKFCQVCHTMEPMVEAYHQDIHGGKNKFGVQATCVSCHLPHDSITQYMIGKVRVSAHDIWTQFFTDTDKIDWQRKRNRASEFTYDSGCLSCHTNLEEATMGTQKAFVAHRQYFNKLTSKTCVECHNNVGHSNLGDYLK